MASKTKRKGVASQRIWGENLIRALFKCDKERGNGA
jgi:hypothetical protein